MRISVAALLVLPLLTPCARSAASTQNSLVLNGGDTLSVSDSCVALDSFRVEFRIQNPTTGLTGFETAPLMEMPAGFLARFMGPSYNGPISFQDLQDTFPAGQ